MRVFVDTNVLVDFVCDRIDFSKEASILFDLAYREKIEMLICSLSFINAFYIGLKYKYNPAQLQHSLRSIKNFVIVSDLNDSTLTEAFGLDAKDFEDAVQYCSAKSAGADVIVTRNKKDFLDFPIDCLTPKEFLEKHIQ